MLEGPQNEGLQNKNITATCVGYLPLNMVEAFKKRIDTGEKRFVEGGTHGRGGNIPPQRGGGRF